MSCHVMSCHVMSCHVMSCHVMLNFLTRSPKFRFIRLLGHFVILLSFSSPIRMFLLSTAIYELDMRLIFQKGRR